MTVSTQPIYQLIPIEKLQSVLQRFSAAVELGCLIVDPHGDVIIEEDWHCFRENDSSTRWLPAFKKCMGTEDFFAGRLPADKKNLVFTFDNGFSCVGAPITIGGQPVASIFVGMFLLSLPESEILQASAAAERFEGTALPEAATNLTVFTKKKVQQIMAQLDLAIDLLAEIGRNSLLERNVNQQIDKTEKRYRDLANSLPQIFCEIDLQGGITFANQSAYENFGYSPHEFVEGLLLYDFIAEADRQKIADRFKSALSGQILEPVECWLVRRDHSTFPGIVFPRPLYVDGKIRGVRGIIIDNTHGKQTEERLRERESAWRVIFQHAPFGIAINRLCDGVYLDVNPAVERISGYKATEILGKTPFMLLPLSSHDASRKVRETLQQKGWTENLEIVIEKRDGTKAHLLYSSATFQSGGEYCAVGESCAVSMLVDITERKVIEEKLQQSEATLQSLFQAAPVGLAILKGRAFLAVNERFCEITGYDAVGLLNQSSRHLYESEEEYQRVGATLYSRLHEQGTCYVETRHRHRDGSLRGVSLFAAPIDPIDPETGVAVAIQDITDQKKIFQELRDNEERFRTLFESASDAIMIFKYQSSIGNTIVDCNMKALEMFGCTRHEMRGRSLGDFSPAFQPDGRTYLDKGSAYVAEALQGIPQHFEWGCTAVLTGPCSMLMSASVPLNSQESPMKYLKLLGYQVTASQSSLITLKTFRDNPQGYDLLITDQTMPEMTGVQLIQEIRKISSTMPVILCTGYSETVSEDSAHYYGVTEFLMKPINIHDLAKTIAAVLSENNQSP